MILDLQMLNRIFAKFSEELRSSHRFDAETMLRVRLKDWAAFQTPKFLVGGVTAGAWIFGASQAEVMLVTDEEYIDEWYKIEHEKEKLSNLWKKFCLRKNIVRIRVTLNDDGTIYSRIKSSYER